MITICFITYPGDFVPPYLLTRSLVGAPCPTPLAWLARCAHSHPEDVVLIRGTSSRRTPLHARSWGPLAPRRSRGSLAVLTRIRRTSSLSGGLRPAGPPYTLARGGPLPHAARVARSLCSLASGGRR